jgi:SNF2 family DNA or RNA helicase
MFEYKTKPFEHQVRAFNFARDKEAFALFMEMGTGKTKTTIDLACDMYRAGEINAVLIIAPNGVHTQWIREQLPIHCSVPYFGVAFKSTASKALKNDIHKICTEPFDGLKFLAVNVEAFSYQTYMSIFFHFVTEHNTFVVIDEATAIKNPDAKRTQNIIRGLSACKWRGKSLIACEPLSVKRAILTGTPITNSPFDIWAMAEFLQPNFFNRTYFAFKAHYGIQRQIDVHQGQLIRKVSVPLKLEEIKSIYEMDTLAACQKFGMRESDVEYIKQNKPEHSYKHLDELKERIKEFAFFVTKDECLDLEPKIYKRRVVEMSDEQKASYLGLENEFITEYAGKELSVLNKVALYTRLSQIAGGFFPFTEENEETGEFNKDIIPFTKNPKLDALLEDIDFIDYPAVVVTRFTAEAKIIYEALSKRGDLQVGCYIGELKEPKDPIQAFKDGYLHILVANERMISKGHNLQNAHNVLFYSNSYSLEERLQTEDRIHRSGQTEKCLYIDYIADGTVDMKVYASLRSNKKLLDYMRGVSVDTFLSEVTDEMKEEFAWLNE